MKAYVPRILAYRPNTDTCRGWLLAPTPPTENHFWYTFTLLKSTINLGHFISRIRYMILLTVVMCTSQGSLMEKFAEKHIFGKILAKKHVEETN